jgi:hypothetical protein
MRDSVVVKYEFDCAIGQPTANGRRRRDSWSHPQDLSFDIGENARRCPIDRYVHPLVFPAPTNLTRRMNIHDDLARCGVRPASAFARYQIHVHRAEAVPEFTKRGQQFRLHKVSRVVGELEAACV